MDVLGKFIRARGGAAAVEFALVASMLTLMLSFVLILGLSLYVNQAVDLATAKAARQIMTGAVQLQATQMTTSQFRDQFVCPPLPALVSCNSVIVKLYKVEVKARMDNYFRFLTDDWSSLRIPQPLPGDDVFQLGIQGDYQYLLVIYPMPLIPPGLASLLSNLTAVANGRPALLAVATAAFRNEQY
ncbi:TadE/TadG family type IV pilus assembly protein [Methylobacterium sp. WSM2598]|uniref:TadE/TadG family type IV pilus assembly protein n=1 Tax=Methylobacterium sp. WSM2598 TaxID=398261 RepID=UPI00036BA301|nr:TadE/TadG family type IV pilus assembly protein [Methylobacterium sp. WSM2598]